MTNQRHHIQDKPNNTSSSRGWLWGLMLAAALIAMSAQATAQTAYRYVLTDGNIRWETRANAAATEYNIEEVKLYAYGVSAPTGATGRDTTLRLTKYGELSDDAPNSKRGYYLRLNISTEDATEATVEATKEFDPYCVWTRTSATTGNYYQEWGEYKYFLIGNNSQSSPTVQVIKIVDPSNDPTLWYDWDYGTAMWEIYTIDGRTVSQYYWVVLDTTSSTPQWRMSKHSYDRPESFICGTSNCDPIQRFYAEYAVMNETERIERDVNTNMLIHQPTGLTAQFMPVEVTRVEATFDEADKGLTELTVDNDHLTYGDKELLTLGYTNGTVQVRQEHVVYAEALTRTGIGMHWDGDRMNGRVGDTISRRMLYKADGVTALADSEVETVAGVLVPKKTNSNVGAGEVQSVEYSFNRRARRYLRVDEDTESGVDKAYVVCFSSPTVKGVADTLTVTVTYTGGVVQRKTLLVYPQYEEPMPDTTSTKGTVVKGNIFGGGRKAGVNEDTRVTVHNCHYVAGVFGGNDVSGVVVGGSTVKIGSTHTNDSVRIGEVYGGGNGYYDYSSSEYSKYSMPQIVTTDVTIGDGVGTDLATATVRVDSVFGGAKNADITGSGTAVTVTMKAGTVMALFGGNNYGGSLKDGSTISITIDSTDLAEASATDIHNTVHNGYGRTFGVRSLFGGGNKVEAPMVDIKFHGGMVDSLFAGGNSASVTATTCEVYTDTTTSDKAIFENSTTELGPSHWAGGHGRYNIRTLFGGNNLAEMECLPTLTLKRGGIGTVFGGGNAGHMLADVANSTLTTLIENGDDGMTLPTKVGTYIDLPDDSEIEIDYLYGGCQMADVKHSTFVRIGGGTIGTVFGGCNISGNVGEESGDGTYVVMEGGTVRANLFGGSNGYYHCNNEDNDGPRYKNSDIDFRDALGNDFDPYDDYIGIKIPTHNNTNVLIKDGEVKGNVYGGANLTNVGFRKAMYSHSAQAGSVHMTMTGGTVEGNVFGGGNMASIWGLSYLHVGQDYKEEGEGTPTINGALYAGNDKSGKVDNFGAYAKRGESTANFMASDGTKLNDANNDYKSASYSAYVRIDGKPTIGEVYGGGNGDYDYTSLELCKLELPAQQSAFIDINTKGGDITTVYGGGNGVGVSQTVLVLLNTQDTKGQYVETIYGGNNKDNMDRCVPDVVLRKGIVKNVFGGSNQGDMGHTVAFADLCDRAAGLGRTSVQGVSTHIEVNSDSVTVTGALYGGCNMANVKGMAFIDIINTSEEGINYVFGGNDISGTVGSTRIDVSGGTVQHIYGGSNGAYDYVQYNANNYDVYQYGQKEVAGATPIVTGVSTLPTVGSTYVNIYGGAVMSSVFGGGRMGDCDSTHVVINDEKCSSTARNTEIHGTIYGGGEGDTTILMTRRDSHGNIIRHRGNVNGASRVNLYHAGYVKDARAYGGGRGGDVYNSYITMHESWDQPFDELYGGCWGSDVYGTATVTLSGQDGAYNVYDVYGGNDFTGTVYKTVVNINNGQFNNVYGGGNGLHTRSGYKVPNNEYAMVNMNGGTVINNLYGGGRLGTTWVLLEDANGIDSIYADGYYHPDTLRDVANAYSDPKEYSNIIVNMTGGTVDKKVFAGGAGDETPLVYGLKMFNMSGGIADEVYGGSESVDDGYWSECKDSLDNTTTMRPSSIVNIVGGQVRTNVYGAGYLGLTHGSAYVNIGLHAIDSCVLWSKTIATQDSAYKSFKPTLTASTVRIGGSVYGGPDWGQSGTSGNFSPRGFFGGESRVIVDGSGYETGSDNNADVKMQIKKSIIGTGTSSLSGDILNRIDVYNYGVMNSLTNCNAPERSQLESIQRADELYLHNTAILYTTSTSARDMYDNNRYSINIIGKMTAVGYNVIELAGYMSNIDSLIFIEDDWDWRKGTNWESHIMPHLVQNQTLIPQSRTYGACLETAEMCDKMAVIDPDDNDRRHTAIVASGESGYEVDIFREVDTIIDGEETVVTHYGTVQGFGYLMAASGVNVTVVARVKDQSTNITDGGFASSCYVDNLINNTHEIYADWTQNDDPTRDDIEFPYTNFNTIDQRYRTWSLGKGVRRRSTNVLAYVDIAKKEDDKAVTIVRDTTNGTTVQMGIAHAVLRLPPADPGHYYKLGSEGVLISAESALIELTDSAWIPENWGDLTDTWGGINSGKWYVKAPPTQGLNEISSDPNNTFALAMSCNEKSFMTDASGNLVMPENYQDKYAQTIIPGDKHVTTIQNFCSALVKDTTQITPTMDFYMLYDANKITQTNLARVVFTLDEYVQIVDTVIIDGVSTLIYRDSLLDGRPIEVTLYLTTVIDKFVNVEYEVLAMYNEGRSNIFKRKATLPATLEYRELYMESVKWEPTDEFGNSISATELDTAERFYLTDSEMLISGTQNTFGLHITPTDNLSSTLTSSNGWHNPDPDGYDIYTISRSASGSKTKSSAVNSSNVAKNIDLTANSLYGGRGMYVGSLDGRGVAVLDIDLNFDGNVIYPHINGKGYVGKLTMEMRSYHGTEARETEPFTITVFVKCRDHGDTIYLTSDPLIDGVVYNYAESRWKDTTYGPASTNDPIIEIGKSPSKYVNDITWALSSSIYQEGDVVCIIGNGYTVTGQPRIQGIDYFTIPIIRYDGHHHELPGDKYIPRGAMITVGAGASLSASGIAFDGGHFAKTRNTKYGGSNITDIGDPTRNDTTKAYGPILAVKDGGALVLADGTTVMNNYNANTADAADSLLGAISLTNGGQLTLRGNVTIADNISNRANYDDEYPLLGAVYINNGEMTLAASNTGSKITITDNYLMDTPNTGDDPYWDVYNPEGDTLRYMLPSNFRTDSTRANVLLTRKAPTSSTDPTYLAMNDNQSDIIKISGQQGNDTRIGVSKWFPNKELHLRDTIRIAYSPDETNLDTRYFQADGPYNIFYHEDVNSEYIYLHDCRTFMLQTTGQENIAYLLDGSSTISAKSPIEYLADMKAVCPKGTDAIVANVRDGFLPYTYAWSVQGTQQPSRKTVGRNKDVSANVVNGDYSRLLDAIYDTIQTPAVLIRPTDNDTLMVYNITVTDLAGCEAIKTVKMRISKEESDAIDFSKTDHSFNITSDTNSWDTISADTAYAIRQYQAIHVKPVIVSQYDKTDISISAKPSIYLIGDNDIIHDSLITLRFCEGDAIVLNAKPNTNLEQNDSSNFIMWDIDPYYKPEITYIVPTTTTQVTAYFGPTRYWKDTISSTTIARAALDTHYYYSARPNFTNGQPASYVTTYHDDVHIYDERGLAWFISVVNGLNGTQARQFYFNRVYIHQKTDGTAYDMTPFLWTPVGTAQHPFRGYLIGVSGNDTTTVPLCDTTTDNYVVIKNIMVNEPNMAYTGFFGHIDSARVMSIRLESAFVRGSQYVGTMAAHSKDSKIVYCKVDDESDTITATILTTHYVSGGLIGLSENDSIGYNAKVQAKFVGDAVYCGGLVGYNKSSKIYNNYAINLMRMTALYQAGAVGHSEGDPTPSGLFHAKSIGNPAEIMNNYVRVESDLKAERVGGIVGYAKNTIIENNYVYGNLQGSVVSGGVAAVADQGTETDHNYYAYGSVEQAAGQVRNGAMMSNNTSFSGKGNAVSLSDTAYGTNNLTMALNRWVLDHGRDRFNTWCNDTTGINHGYPIFGAPGLMTIHTDIALHGCDSLVYGGQTYYADDSLTTYAIDSVAMIDTISTTHIYIGHSNYTEYSDTAQVGEAYSGYGFFLSTTETELLRQTLDSEGKATIVLTDTLTTATGCDSIVSLTLTFYGTSQVPEVREEPSTVSVYPNPTTADVNVVADGLQHVELYDNDGRTLADYTCFDGATVSFSVFDLSSGVYYLRIHTTTTTTIQKLIKK